MGALAALFREAGDDVSGSDTAFDPPIGPMLQSLGVRCEQGFDAARFDGPARPDLVVIGNAIRRTNPEAEAAERLGLARASMSGALRERPDHGRAPFVVEGDEYDAVYWHKRAKFFDYVGVGPDDVVIVTSVEHDHIDIYPDRASYEAAFRELVRAVPEKGLVVCDAHDAAARAIVAAEARAEVAWYALDHDDTG